MVYKPFTRKVFYCETDKMAVVHHSNYLRYLEEARIDFLEQSGYPYDKMEENGVLIPVMTASCRYKRALRYGDEMMIKMRIEEFNGFKFTVSYQIINTATNEVNATAETSHFFVDEEFKPIRTKSVHPEIYRIFSEIIQKDIYSE